MPCSTVQLIDALICLQDRGEQVTHATDPLEYYQWRERSRGYGASIQFLPGERRGNRWMIWVSTQCIGCRRVTSETVLRIIHRHAASLVGRTAGWYNQVGIVRRELIPHRFDPATNALEGVENVRKNP